MTSRNPIEAIAPPAMQGDTIHVWRVALDACEQQAAMLEGVLSHDECQRARRFRAPRDQRRFIVARGALRSVLAGCLGCDPAGIEFCYGAHGKPTLPPINAESGLHFNVSHSADLALIAVRQGAAIGVDIERIRRDFACAPIANRFFCPAEIAWLNRLAISDQHDGFFTLWTRKEAFLKAQGQGIWQDLSRFDVSQSVVLERDRPAAWHLLDMDFGSEFKAALAAEGPLPPVKMLEWPMPRKAAKGEIETEDG